MIDEEVQISLLQQVGDGRRMKIGARYFVIKVTWSEAGRQRGRQGGVRAGEQEDHEPSSEDGRDEEKRRGGVRAERRVEGGQYRP